MNRHQNVTPEEQILVATAWVCLLVCFCFAHAILQYTVTSQPWFSILAVSLMAGHLAAAWYIGYIIAPRDDRR